MKPELDPHSPFIKVRMAQRLEDRTDRKLGVSAGGQKTAKSILMKEHEHPYWSKK